MKTVIPNILRSLADSGALQIGRCAEHNGRSEAPF